MVLQLHIYDVYPRNGIAIFYVKSFSYSISQPNKVYLLSILWIYEIVPCVSYRLTTAMEATLV